MAPAHCVAHQREGEELGLEQGRCQQQQGNGGGEQTRDLQPGQGGEVDAQQFGVPAFAQQAPGESVTLGEVVVTAQNRAEMVDMAVAKLGQKRDAIEASAPNVELIWRLGDTEIQQAKKYAEHMLALKQIRRLPDFATFIDTRFVDEMKTA